MVHEVLEPGDEWYINCPEFNNNFWFYINANSHPNGQLDEHTIANISKLLGINPTEVSNTIAKLTEVFKMDQEIMSLYAGISIDTLDDVELIGILSQEDLPETHYKNLILDDK